MTTTQQVVDILSHADLARIRVNDVRESIGIGRRGLEQRLEREGTTYAELLREERMRRCRAMLERNPYCDGYRLAKTCGYLKVSNAYQAFKRWYGIGWKDVKGRGLPTNV